MRRPAAGVLVVSRETGRWLAVRRSGIMTGAYTWGLPGGGLHSGESFQHAAVRELREETKYKGVIDIVPWCHVGDFVAFVGFVGHEFQPRLDQEHIEFWWVRPFRWPEPAHPGMRAALRDCGRELRVVLDLA